MADLDPLKMLSANKSSFSFVGLDVEALEVLEVYVGDLCFRGVE